MPTAVLVVEVISVDDETYQKFEFYFRHGVEEVIVADPQTRILQWWQRGDQGFEAADESAVLGVSVASIASRIDWP